MDRPRTAHALTYSNDGVAQEFPEIMEEMLRKGLAILWRAYHYSRDLNTDSQEFAVSHACLYRAGLTPVDLRWLLARGFVQIMSPKANSERAPDLQLQGKGRVGLVLTNSGVGLAKRLFQKTNQTNLHSAPSAMGPAHADHSDEAAKLATQKPHWDRERKELRYRGLIVKQFRWSAVNQETILMAFEEDDWAARIDDPLPQNLNQDPKQRLHDTIKCLNRNHKKRIIRFSGDGTGEGIRWVLVDHANGD
jgi:hypothetical protein